MMAEMTLQATSYGGGIGNHGTCGKPWQHGKKEDRDKEQQTNQYRHPTHLHHRASTNPLLPFCGPTKHCIAEALKP